MNWRAVQRKEGEWIAVPRNWLHLHYYDALTVLFRVENALRVFVFVVLKSTMGKDWLTINITGDDDSQGTIGTIGKKRMGQQRTFGYLGYLTPCPVMYLTIGELIRVITSEGCWKHFADYFPASKEIVKNKLEEIESVRGALAHFRPIKEDDVEVIKQNAKQLCSRRPSPIVAGKEIGDALLLGT